MDSLFSSQFCLSDLFGEQLMMTKLLHCCNSKLAPYLYSPRHAPLLSVLPVVNAKGSWELKMSWRESSFSVTRSRLTWRVLIFDEQIA